MRRLLVLTLWLGAAALPALPVVAQSEPSQAIWTGEEYVFFARPKGPRPTPPPAPERIEHVIKRFPSGQVQFDGYQLGKVKVGVWSQFDRSGNLLSETPYVRGVQHGEVIRYHTTCANKANNSIAAARTHYHFDRSRTGPTSNTLARARRRSKDNISTTSDTASGAGTARAKTARSSPGSGPTPVRSATTPRAPSKAPRLHAEAIRAFLKKSCTPAPVQSMAAAPNIFDCDDQALVEWKSGLHCRDRKRPTHLWRSHPLSHRYRDARVLASIDVDHPEPRQAGRPDPGPRGGGKAPPGARGAEARARRRSPALRLSRLRTRSATTTPIAPSAWPTRWNRFASAAET